MSDRFWVARSLGGKDHLRRALVPAFMPAVFLASFWLAGEQGLIVAAIIAPFALAISIGGEQTNLRGFMTDPLTGLYQRDRLMRILNDDTATWDKGRQGGAALVVEIDGFRQIQEQHGREAVERILRTTAHRLRAAVRDDDVPACLEGPTFAVALSKAERLDINGIVGIANRLQIALSEPIAVDAANIYVTVSIGGALASRLDHPDGLDLIEAATAAMMDAQRQGPAAIRIYSEAMRQRIRDRKELSHEVAEAMERGEYLPFFQPQVSATDGRLIGLETLARWRHPTRGIISPGEFLPAVESSGLMDRLGEIMVYHALAALRRWDLKGLGVPRVSVNFSASELRDPKLVDRLQWELDRFELEPDRLGIEVLETVVAESNDDVIVRNLSGLAALGCVIELDDFGTGHAAITNIRRFSVRRLKIDRSFVARSDVDTDQRRMVAAIQAMATELGLQTLAEGIETSGEAAQIARLGCDCMQGFGIARPMSLEDAEEWLRTYKARKPGTLAKTQRTA